MSRRVESNLNVDAQLLSVASRGPGLSWLRPGWNPSLPATCKFWLERLAQPGRTLNRLEEKGQLPLAEG